MEQLRLWLSYKRETRYFKPDFCKVSHLKFEEFSRQKSRPTDRQQMSRLVHDEPNKKKKFRGTLEVCAI